MYFAYCEWICGGEMVREDEEERKVEIQDGVRGWGCRWLNALSRHFILE